MPLDKKKVEASLEQKGFNVTNTHHRVFMYQTLGGTKTAVRTFTSQGSKGRDLSDSLVSQMARQCKVSKQDFTRLVNCPLDRAGYERLLREAGELDE